MRNINRHILVKAIQELWIFYQHFYKSEIISKKFLKALKLEG